MRRVLVIGNGVAGTAAALAASHRGAHVVVVASGTGASALAPGALDDAPWEQQQPPLAPSPHAAEILEQLDAFVLPNHGALVATIAGILRPARALDRSLLDLSPLSSATVLVPRLEHGAWDGTSLARAWSDSRFAVEKHLRFVTAAAHLTRFVEERSLPDADLAARHDDPARLGWLGDQLRDALGRVPGRVGAVVLPPWLGIERPRAQALSERLGVPCGEALAGSGGPSGLRFERARDRALARAGVDVVVARVVRLERDEAGFRARVEEGTEPEPADAVVLATGGLIGGGLEYTPAGSVLAAELPPAARPLLRATLDAPVTLGAEGAPLAVPGSLFGAPPESHAWPFVADSLLERAGVLVDGDGHACGGPRGLFAAGELVADRPRTWLAALAGGARAGAEAAHTSLHEGAVADEGAA